MAEENKNGVQITEAAALITTKITKKKGNKISQRKQKDKRQNQNRNAKLVDRLIIKDEKRIGAFKTPHRHLYAEQKGLKIK